MEANPLTGDNVVFVAETGLESTLEDSDAAESVSEGELYVVQEQHELTVV